MIDKTRSKRASPRSAILFAAASALAALCLVPSAASAQEDGGGSLSGTVLRVLGITRGKSDTHSAISYRRRAPLVLPKSMSLPPPQPRAAKRDPAWPQDPDVLRAERAAALERAPRQPLGQDTGMTKQQMLKQRDIADTPGGPADCGEFSGDTCDPHKIWAALSVKKGADPDSQSLYAAGQAPVRKYLTQPPSRYMIPTKVVKPTVGKQINPDAEDNPNIYFRDQARRQHSVD